MAQLVYPACSELRRAAPSPQIRQTTLPWSCRAALSCASRPCRFVPNSSCISIKTNDFLGSLVILSSLLAAGRAALSRPDAVCRRRSSQRTPHFGFNTPLHPGSLQLTHPTYHPPARLVNALTPNALKRPRTVIFRPRTAPPHPRYCPTRTHFHSPAALSFLKCGSLASTFPLARRCVGTTWRNSLSHFDTASRFALVSLPGRCYGRRKGMHQGGSYLAQILEAALRFLSLTRGFSSRTNPPRAAIGQTQNRLFL